MTWDREIVEKWAIKLARGNNGGEWATHYNEDQKNFWRNLAEELINEISVELINEVYVDLREEMIKT